MRCLKLYTAVLVLICQAMCPNCSTDSTLIKYNIDHVLYWTNKTSDSSREIITEWYINICDSDRTSMPRECDDNDIICSLSWVKNPEEAPSLNKTINFKEKYLRDIWHSFGFSELHFHEKWYNDQYILGPAMRFKCDPRLDTDKIIAESELWANPFFYISGPSGCVKEKYNYNGHANDSGYDPSVFLQWYGWVLAYVAFLVVVLLFT